MKLCNIFNDYYVNVTNDIGEDEYVDLNGPLCDIVNMYANHPSILAIKDNLVDSCSNFEFHAVNSDVLFKKLISVKSNKACGFDGQPPKLINIGAPALKNTLLPIVNQSIASCNFPSDLNMAEVSPIFKKDNRMKKEKNHPISILPGSSKPFECIIFDQVTNYFNNILSTFLAAYHIGYSTQHVLIKAIEDVKCSLDNGEHVG